MCCAHNHAGAKQTDALSKERAELEGRLAYLKDAAKGYEDNGTHAVRICEGQYTFTGYTCTGCKDRMGCLGVGLATDQMKHPLVCDVFKRPARCCHV
jgi:hypothetical protein